MTKQLCRHLTIIYDKSGRDHSEGYSDYWMLYVDIKSKQKPIRTKIPLIQWWSGQDWARSAVISQWRQFHAILVKMEPAKTVESMILFWFWTSINIECRLLCLMPMVMPFVQIAEHEWNVEVLGLRTLKNAIKQVVPAKMLRVNGNEVDLGKLYKSNH